MNKVKLGLLSALMLIGFCFLSIVVAQLNRNDQKSQNGKIDEATPIQIGVMNDRQKEHAKLFEGYGTGKKISVLLAGKNEVSLVRAEPLEGSEPDTPQFNLNDFIRNATCNADAVIVGTVAGKSSQLTSDEYFVFTDYTVNAKTVLKDSNNAPIQPESPVIVTRPGGKVNINGRIVTAVDQSAKPLRKGENYILFLKYIPRTGSYTLLNDTSLLSTQNSETQKLTNEHLDDPFEQADPSFVIDTIRVSSETCTNKTQGGKK